MHLPPPTISHYVQSFEKKYFPHDTDMEEMEYISTFLGYDSFASLFLNNGGMGQGPRREKWIHLRMSWIRHAAQLCYEKKFEKEYRMDYEDWKHLVQMLFPLLRRHSTKSRTYQPVTVDIIAAIGMRVLAGGTKNDVRHIFSTSTTECHRCFHDFMFAVLTCRKLDISLPQSGEEWERVRTGFLHKSSRKLLRGTVGAIDGFFQPTIAPSVPNMRSYYSGHYESYGLNCQAACDSNLRFLYFGVVAAGSTNDNVAYAMAHELKEAIDALPLGYYFVGDAAYTLSERLLVPFTGSQRSNIDNDCFNYNLSQMRIRIEIAFGLMVSKFRILKKKLEGSIKTNAKVIMCCARLHNYIIDRKFESKNNDVNDTEQNGENVDPNRLGYTSLNNSPLDMVYCPTIPDEDIFEEIQGESNTRDAIVHLIHERKERRPAHNIIRNARDGEVVAIINRRIDEAGEANEAIAFKRDIEVEYFHPQ